MNVRLFLVGLSPRPLEFPVPGATVTRRGTTPLSRRWPDTQGRAIALGAVQTTSWPRSSNSSSELKQKVRTRDTSSLSSDGAVVPWWCTLTPYNPCCSRIPLVFCAKLFLALLLFCRARPMARARRALPSGSMIRRPFSLSCKGEKICSAVRFFLGRGPPLVAISASCTARARAASACRRAFSSDWRLASSRAASSWARWATRRLADSSLRRKAAAVASAAARAARASCSARCWARRSASARHARKVCSFRRACQTLTHPCIFTTAQRCARACCTRRRAAAPRSAAWMATAARRRERNTAAQRLARTPRATRCIWIAALRRMR
mmetsp:Transcript_19641/g.47551  ORF Transcript_19641/g.47551 Transcript_19641/m.47551 type:complete len:323 (-) Transcript_19641:2553-3521(-)